MNLPVVSVRQLPVLFFLLLGHVGLVAADSFGTGFFVSSSGHLITNAHVIRGAEAISVRNSAGKEWGASVLSVDENNDLALLKIEANTQPLFLKSVASIDTQEILEYKPMVNRLLAAP